MLSSPPLVAAMICIYLSGCTEAFVQNFLPATRWSILSSSRRRYHICIKIAPADTDDHYFEKPNLTPNQIKSLRKEISKRRAAKKIPNIWLDDDETSGPFSDETLAGIIDLFGKHELVEVRGISKDEKKMAPATCQQLAFELSLAADKPVDLVEIKGHAGTFYSPGDMEDRIILRSSYKEGAWTKRPKAPRDNRGQIIRED